MSGRILVTPRSLSKGTHPGLAPLWEAGFELVAPTPGAMPTEADLLKAVPGCVGWLAGVEPVSKNVIASADALQVISRNGTGIDNLPIEAVQTRKITVKRAVATNARGVAELALCLTLAGLRQVVPTHLGLTAGDWPRLIGGEIQGAVVAVIGLGAIGQEYVRFASALDACPRGYDPYAPALDALGDRFQRMGLADALKGADIVSLHAPMAKDEQPILTSDTLANLNPGAVVVNTARAGLIDDAAMLSALSSGQVRCYATDVFDREPPELSALLRHPNVIMTSHIGGFTTASIDRTTARAVENLLHVLKPNAV